MKTLTNEENLRLVRKWKAATTVTEKNRIATLILKGLEGLLWKIVRRKRWIAAQDREDCFSVACATIVTHVLPNFSEEKSKNCKFSSYAGNWVESYVERANSIIKSTVYVPLERETRAMKAVAEGKELSEKDKAYLTSVTYWDRPAKSSGDGEDSTPLSELMAYTHGLSVQPEGPSNLEKLDIKKYTDRLIDSLNTPRKKDIVTQIMHGVSYREIGNQHGISSSRVEQIYSTAIRKFRVLAFKWKLKEESNLKANRRVNSEVTKHTTSINTYTPKQLLVKKEKELSPSLKFVNLNKDDSLERTTLN